MRTKLTLRLEEDLIKRAKRYSSESGKSVSQLVADYFLLIDQASLAQGELAPKSRSLYGALAGAVLTEADYRDHLERKYQ
jgi:hypothetical protein